MRIICIGYGRLGTQLVKLLDTRQHDVVVIDKNRTALERRDRDLHAKFFFGNAIDEHVLREAGVAVVPGEAFGTQEHFRISYATSIETLGEGLQRMKRFFSEQKH